MAMVSCVEHVNAYLGHEFLAQRMLEDADPDLRVLFEWHFAEEIEHKHVAYDVMQHLWPSYVLRLLGALMCLQGLSAALLGPQHAQTVLDWETMRPALLRAGAIVALACGVFMVFALTTGRRRAAIS